MSGSSSPTAAITVNTSQAMTSVAISVETLVIQIKDSKFDMVVVSEVRSKLWKMSGNSMY